MKIEYDREADALYIALTDAKVARTEEAEIGVNMDYDRKGRLIGIEVLGVSEKYSATDLNSITATDLVGAKVAAS
ncbi:DUF2283 domain-containing protein [bacterium]|nr:DUF2283 domain-containing protein [bacterium]